VGEGGVGIEGDGDGVAAVAVDDGGKAAGLADALAVAGAGLVTVLGGEDW
jgi:hypothetical protein